MFIKWVQQGQIISSQCKELKMNTECIRLLVVVPSVIQQRALSHVTTSLTFDPSDLSSKHANGHFKLFCYVKMEASSDQSLPERTVTTLKHLRSSLWRCSGFSTGTRWQSHDSAGSPASLQRRLRRRPGLLRCSTAVWLLVNRHTRLQQAPVTSSLNAY